MHCVVMPIYKKFDSLSANELISLGQLYSVLGRHSICLIGSAELEWEEYINHAKSFNTEIFIKHFNKSFFLSVQGYNSLLLSLAFYRSFKQFEYILIYQTDAYVFKDELDYWCRLNYDYIGAPWFEGWHNAGDNAKFLGIGNGGFSLRKVRSCLKVLKSFSYVVPPKRLINDFRNSMSIKNLVRLFFNLTIKNNTFYLLNNWTFNEDYFWGMIASTRFSWFQVPDLKTALRFSIEVNPQTYIFSFSDIPFGCHGWWKYNSEFWKKYVSNEGSKI